MSEPQAAQCSAATCLHKTATRLPCLATPQPSTSHYPLNTASPHLNTARRPALKGRGFTLIEVLVALAITSIALLSGLKISGALTRNAQRQGDVLLAQICANNALNQQRLLQQMPSVGNSRLPCPQAERQFEVALTVRTTPNPAFRRVDAQVFEQATPILNLTTVLGRY